MDELFCVICGAEAYATPTGWQCAAYSSHSSKQSIHSKVKALLGVTISDKQAELIESGVLDIEELSQAINHPTLSADKAIEQMTRVPKDVFEGKEGNLIPNKDQFPSKR